LAQRYALKLLSLKFETGKKNVFILQIAFDKPHQSILPIGPERLGRAYTCGLNVAEFGAYDDTQRHLFFITAIHSMLISAATSENLDVAKVDAVRDFLVASGENLEIEIGLVETPELTIQAAYTIAAESRLVLNVVEKTLDRSMQIQVIILDDYNDVFKLVSNLSIKSDSICIHPRRSDLGSSTLKRYWERLDQRGFLSRSRNCISIPLSSITQPKV